MILHSFDYPPLDGGISRLCAEIALGCRRRGTEIIALTQSSSAETSSRVPEIPEVRVTSDRPRREWQAMRWLKQNMRTGTVVCGTWYPEGLLATIVNSRPRIILAHGSELLPTRSPLRRGVWRRIQKRVLESADLIVANSEYTRRLVLETAPRSRVAAVPLAVDHRRFQPGDPEAAKASLDVSGRLVISTVSRLRDYKGHDVVFQALASLPIAVRKRFVHLIAGQGPDQAALQSKAKDLGIDELVRWLGYVSEENLPNLYRASDLFVLCTRESPRRREVEGFGLVFLEAQACGIPVVGTRTGGVADAIVDGEGGRLIAQDDAKALAEILLNLADDPRTFIEAGITARARIEREATWDHYMRRFEKVLKSEGILDE